MTDVGTQTQLRAPRYVVTEIEGYLQPKKPATHALPGLTAHVLDTAFNHRVVFTARTEDDMRRGNVHIVGPTPWQRRERVRAAAQERCDLLNALDELATISREAVSPHSETGA